MNGIVLKDYMLGRIAERGRALVEKRSLRGSGTTALRPSGQAGADLRSSSIRSTAMSACVVSVQYADCMPSFRQLDVDAVLGEQKNARFPYPCRLPTITDLAALLTHNGI
jgi:hypothetical protein